MRRLLSCAVVVATLLGCAPTPVDVQATFPSVETFLYSDFGRLLVYELEDDQLGACPSLVDQVVRAEIGSPQLDSGWQPICTFQEGGVRFPDVPPGPHAYVIVARDEANRVLLSGCRVAEAYEGAPSVHVTLYPTADYAMATAGRTLTCRSVADKCQQGCR